jgi:hypothetical protein
VQGSSAVSRPDSAVPSPKPEKENQAPSGREIQTGFYTPDQLFQAAISCLLGPSAFSSFSSSYCLIGQATILHFYTFTLLHYTFLLAFNPFHFKQKK